MSSPLVIFELSHMFVIRETDDWGIKVLDLASPPRNSGAANRQFRLRFAPTLTRIKLSRVLCRATAHQPIARGGYLEHMSKRSLSRFEAFFLIAEDPQRRLDTRKVVTLAPSGKFGSPHL